MELMKSVIQFLFVLFLIYTTGFIALWLIGLDGSLDHFSASHDRRLLTRSSLPNRIAKDIPVAAVIPA